MALPVPSGEPETLPFAAAVARGRSVPPLALPLLLHRARR